MNTIGLLQPGKLGDLIICLPIAKYFHDIGYKVVWPVFYNYIDMFKEVVDYVDYHPVTNNVYQCVSEANALFKKLNIKKVYDIAATFPGSTCTDEYVKNGDGLGLEKFDEFKYRKCNVPFNLKWHLEYNRNIEKENRVYYDLVEQDKYDIVGVKHSRGSLPIKFESKNQIIEISENYNIFHWRKVLENASSIALVDSAMANFVEQLNIKNKKILLLKPGHPRPTFKNDWKIKEV